MAGRDRSKDASLAASRTLNPHPEAVTDPAFTSGAFFDPANLVQVKYEMVRAVGGRRAGRGRRRLGVRPGPPELLQRQEGSCRARAARPDPGQAGPEQAQADGGGAGLRWSSKPPPIPVPSSAQLAASRTSSASPCTSNPSSAPWPGRPPGTSARRWPKAADTEPACQGAGQDAGAAVLASAYEQLRSSAASGLGGGWRYGAAVLAASGMAAWMASAATWTPQRPPADRRDSAAAQTQAGQSSPPTTSPCPPSRRKEARTPAQPARRCCPPRPASSSQ